MTEASARLLHETSRRLRIGLPLGAAPEACEATVLGIDGVQSTRLNRRLACLVVAHDGRTGVRDAVLAALNGGRLPARSDALSPRLPSVRAIPPTADPGEPAAASAAMASWAPLALAAMLPWLGGPWRAGAAALAVGARLAGQPQRWRERPLATLLEGGGQLSLALSGQAPVVATSLVLRWVAERLSARFVGQSDHLLAQLLPSPAAQYLVLREPGGEPSWWPMRQLQVGDRLRLYPGDVVPLDGCVVLGDGWLEPVLPGSPPHPVRAGDAVAAGERLRRGSLELRVEADAAHSRLERLQHQLKHLLAARPGSQVPRDVGSGLALPLTAAALVLGFTGDRSRAAALLQADPQHGPDLARPVAREAALLALARQGLLTTGPESLQRLARAPVLLIEVQGVLSSGRWTLESLRPSRGVSAARVQRWLKQLAGAEADADETALHLPDRQLREWCRHGALLRSAGRELHWVDAARLQRVWGLTLDEGRAAEPGPPRRVLACVSEGRVLATLVFVSPWQPALADGLRQLADLGFERIALVGSDAPLHLPGAVWLEQASTAADWLAQVTEGGRRPAVMLHRSLRDLVPPGSLSLSPLDADGGAHGLLVGEPLSRLVVARRLAQRIDRQLHWHEELAVGANAALMTLGALRLLKPMTTALLHHGTALALLLQSLHLEASAAVDFQPPQEKTQYET